MCVCASLSSEDPRKPGWMPGGMARPGTLEWSSKNYVLHNTVFKRTQSWVYREGELNPGTEWRIINRVKMHRMKFSKN